MAEGVPQGIGVESGSREVLIDITGKVSAAVREAGWEDGVLLVFAPHTTAAITINENADPDVPQDIVDGLQRVAARRAGYRHAEGNSDAHIKSSLVGASELVAVRSGELVLGTWQGIFFCEFDGPRRRRVELTFLAAAPASV